MKTFQISFIIYVVFGFTIYCQQKTNDTLFVNGINRESLSEYVTYWVDSSKTTPIKNIEKQLSKNFFNHWQENQTLNLGKNPYPLWFHLNIKNTSKKYQNYWWGIYTQADTITVYRKYGENYKCIDTIVSSDLLDSKKVRTRFPAIKIELAANECNEYLVKIENLRNTQNAITDLTTPEDNLMWEKKFYWSIAFFVGCFLLIALVSLFFGILSKEKVFIFYTLYLLIILAMILTEELMIGIIKNKFLFYVLNHLHSLPNAVVALSLHFMIIKFIFYNKKDEQKIKILDTINHSFLCFGLIFAISYFFFKEQMVFDSGIFSFLWEFSIWVVLFNMIITLLAITLKFKNKTIVFLSFILGILFLYYNPAGYFLNYAGILKYYKITYPNYFYWIVCAEFILICCVIGWRYQRTQKANFLLISEKAKIKERNFRKKIKIQQNERIQIAKDLHDDLGATLSAVNLIVTNSYQDDKPLVEMINRANNDLRTFFNKLTFDISNELNFKKRLEEKVYNLNILGEINISLIILGEEKEITEKIKIPLYKICNELINNILKHSKAKEAIIQIMIDDKQIEVLAEDNGIGYNTQSQKKGMGINNIKERVKRWHGSYHVSSNKKGTTSIIKIPNRE